MVALPLNIDVNDTIANIIAGIELALDSAGVTYTSVSVTRTDIGGGLYSFEIIIYESDELINLIDVSGNATVFVETICEPPNELLNRELREVLTDLELREDLTIELRE